MNNLKSKLETFSLPELFRLIDSGSKTGMLTIEKAIEGNKCEIWFESGQLLTIIAPALQQNLLSSIEERGWLSKAVINQINRFYRNNQPLGAYLERMRLWTKEQQQSQFELHLQQIEPLFQLSNNTFELQEISSLSSAESSNDIPWTEMTGGKIRATEVTFKSLRKLDNWEHFIEQLPSSSSCLQRLVKQPTVELLTSELEIWSYADSRTPIKTIAQKLDRPLLNIQKTAFAMSMANLLEETMPSKFTSATPKKLTTTTRFATATAAVATQPSRVETSSEVSTSLLHNLVSFLKGRL
jgi:Domain of unknown function (DUF4388)